MRFWAFSLPLLGPERFFDFQTDAFSAVACS